jgi:hypothetical protein
VGQLAVGEVIVAAAVDRDGAGIGAVERAEDVEQGALARARGPHDRHHLALGDGEADAAQDLHRGGGATEGALEIARLQQRDDGTVVAVLQVGGHLSLLCRRGRRGRLAITDPNLSPRQPLSIRGLPTVVGRRRTDGGGAACWWDAAVTWSGAKNACQ